MISMLALATVLANPVTLPAALVAALPGDRIVLEAGDYPTVTIKNRMFAPMLTVDARKANVRGLSIDKSGGIAWTGGVIRAPGGSEGFASAGYGVRLLNAERIILSGVTVTDSKKGVVLDGGAGITIRGTKFMALREDGIIASRTGNVTISNNIFTDFRPKPTLCTTANAVTYGLSLRDCIAQAGVWRDGDHSDAIQIRNGMASVRITGNRIEGVMQGIGQMDAPTDTPLARVSITDNTVRTAVYHSITLGACASCRISGNDIGNLTPGRKSPIRFRPGTVVCGNTGVAGADAMKPC